MNNKQSKDRSESRYTIINIAVISCDQFVCDIAASFVYFSVGLPSRSFVCSLAQFIVGKCNILRKLVHMYGTEIEIWINLNVT